MTRGARRYQEGAVIVMFAVYTVALVGGIALAVNVYLIGNALIQQRTAVEYVAMSTLKIAKDPTVPFAVSCTQSDLALINCILERAEVAGRVAVGFSQSSFYLPPGALRMVDRGSDTLSGGGCGSPTGEGAGEGLQPGADVFDDEMDDSDFCWPSYKVRDEAFAELVMGTYTDDSGSGHGSFYAARPGAVVAGNLNAIKLRFHLDQASDMKMLAPLISVFGDSIKLKFSSAAIAYVTPGGNIQLAIDPNLSTE
jgi:hypothetical protein